VGAEAEPWPTPTLVLGARGMTLIPVFGGQKETAQYNQQLADLRIRLV
jgi:hypothetical protein